MADQTLLFDGMLGARTFVGCSKEYFSNTKVHYVPMDDIVYRGILI